MRFFSFAFALILILAANPLFAQTADQPTGTIAVTDSDDQDAAIAVRIRDILGELDGYDDVTVAVSSGIVTLRGTTLDTATALRLNDLVGRVESVVAIENEVVETTDVVERLSPAMERFTARMNKVITFIPLALVAAIAFGIIVFAGFVIARMRQPWDRIAPNAFIADIYRQILRIAFGIAGLVVALDILGATALLSTILGAAGIVGLAIGFAVRDTVENFIASIMLSIRQPFRPNDSIEINGDEGMVIRLTSRATILLSFDGNHIRIPNATVFKSRIVNYSRNAERRFLIDFGLAGDTDLTAARDVALEALAALPFVIEKPAPSVWVEGLGDSTITLRCAGWVNQTDTSLALAKGEAIRTIKLALEAAGIQMPEPTYRLISDAAQPASKPKAKRPKAPKSTPATAAVLDEVAADAALDQIIEEERKEQKDSDLLTEAAPEE